jgi:DNA-binding response OmpR family regulator
MKSPRSLGTPTVLVIEDDADIAKAVVALLERAGYEVALSADGHAGLRMLHTVRPDLVILDIGLPGMDGWHVLERIRDLTTTPIIMVTARAHEGDKVRGLQSGADDYLTKPFSNRELVARVEAHLRRATTPPEAGIESLYMDGRLMIDFLAHEVTADDKPVDLTPSEFRLLAVLARHPGQVLSHEQLLELAWNDPTSTGPDRVKFGVLRLRRKLGWDDPDTCPIEAVRGFGYRYRRPPDRVEQAQI